MHHSTGLKKKQITTLLDTIKQTGGVTVVWDNTRTVRVLDTYTGKELASGMKRRDGWSWIVNIKPYSPGVYPQDIMD